MSLPLACGVHTAAHHLPTLNIVMGTMFGTLACAAALFIVVMLWQDFDND